MKLILLGLSALCLLAAPLSARAEPVSQDTANAYYTACMAPDDERMSETAQESLCGCSSAQLMLVMTAEDIQTMSPDPGPGRAAYDKMLAEVYGPCMQIPVEENIYDGCMKNGHIKQFALKDQGKLCRCLATKTTETLPNDAPVIVRNNLKASPGLTDPYHIIAYDPDLRRRALDYLTPCLHLGN
jgi:hypothetical protein